MSLINTILSKIETYHEDRHLNFFIMEPEDYPCFIQFAKLGEDYLLDLPASNFFEDEMVEDLFTLLEKKYRKEIKALKDEPKAQRVTSYQIRFTVQEMNKMCYITKDIFTTILLVDEDSKLEISMR